VGPAGRQIHADAQQNADLFLGLSRRRWKLWHRDGLVVKLQKVESVLVFKAPWPSLSVASAAAAMKAWQAWAPHAPQTIDSNLVIAKGSNGTVDMHAAGQSVGRLQELHRELKALPVSRLFIKHVLYFGRAIFFRSSRLSDADHEGQIRLRHHPAKRRRPCRANERNNSYQRHVCCLRRVWRSNGQGRAGSYSAFAHRDGTLFCLQYGSVWASAGDTQERLNEMRQFYASMRPYVSGGAYVNYCDTDLADWPTAYWGNNLARLKEIKSAFDPDNVFRHAQSVPLA
jgi:Berberine and berberine like